MKRELISVVIVSWNTNAVLKRCLESLSRQDGFDSPVSLETIVIDNASTDGSPEMISKGFPEVRLIQNSLNTGFAHATNQGTRVASGKYVLLLNPDTEVFPGAVKKLVNFLAGKPNAGAVGANLFNRHGSIQPSAFPMMSLPREFWRLFHLDRVYPLATYSQNIWTSESPQKVDVVQGACMLLRREALEQVGLLDESYYMYTEEVDLCYRMARAGWEIYWHPGAKVLHLGGESTKQLKEVMFLRLYESKIQFFRKYQGRLGSMIYKLILLLAAIPRLLSILVKPVLGQHEREELSSITRNYLRLLHTLPTL